MSIPATPPFTAADLLARADEARTFLPCRRIAQATATDAFPFPHR